MVQAKPFGRRVSSQHRASSPVENVEAPGRAKVQAAVSDVAVRPVAPFLRETKLVTAEQDFEDSWQTRKRGFTIPWRPLALMASLCFGITSFVLPDTVNDVVQYLLYALTAAGIFAGFSRRRTGATG